MSDELDALEPAGSSMRYRNEPVDIRPLTIGQLPRLVRKARPVINIVLAMDAMPDTADLGFVDLLLELVGSHGEALYEGVAIAIDRDPAWVAGGDVGEFVELATRVFEVNQDFFARKLVPLLAAPGGRKKPGARGGGPTPSSS